DGVRALPWHEHISPEMTLAVDAHVSGDKITHARFAAQRIKDAIVDGVRALPWHEHISPEMTLAVDAHVSGDKITHAR
ncbi:hypothetical protein C7E12_22370, partial [Stenotrophomonas maltophilia]